MKILIAGNGFETDLKWSKGELVSAKFYSKIGKECRVKYRETSKNLTISRGDFVKVNSNLG